MSTHEEWPLRSWKSVPASPRPGAALSRPLEQHRELLATALVEDLEGALR